MLAGEPGDEPLDRGVFAGSNRPPLVRPAPDLPGVEAAGPAVVAEPLRRRVDGMKRRQGLGQGAIHRATRLGLAAGQGAIVEHAPIEPLHDVERRTDDTPVVAKEKRPRNRHGAAREGRDNAMLAVDRVGGREEVARRLLPQHEAAIVVGDEEGRIRLPARHARDLHRTGEAGQAAAEMGVEAGGVERLFWSAVGHETPLPLSGAAAFTPSEAAYSRRSSRSAIDGPACRSNTASAS